MDRFVGSARLEWWANTSLCLGEYEIDITIAVDAANAWHASGRHSIALDTTEREGWDFLMELDPHFSLAFPGEDHGGILVHIDEAKDGTLTLTETQGRDGSVNITFDLT
ncbi:hypothetical protein [Embleya sp. NPDC020630]|uniref:hypothetical protein n=1 Tax=Embleya sp. NPDC020630 TaxID=3363979 RepID=UPI0037A73929